MSILKSFLFTGIMICFISCKKSGQKIDVIDNVIFTYNSGLRMPFNEVKINIEKNAANENAIVFVHCAPLNNDPEWSYSKRDTFLFIDIKTFDKLAKSIINLQKINIDKAYAVGLDGNTCKIEFGSKGKNTGYSFWSPDFNTKKRGLTDFNSICEEIVKISNLKKEEIFE